MNATGDALLHTREINVAPPAAWISTRSSRRVAAAAAAAIISYD